MADDLVLVDTDVWSKVVLTPQDRDPRVAAWRRLLLGKQLLIASQTEGEVRFGALSRRWGATRIATLEAHLARTPTIPVTSEVVKAFAALRAGCKHSGHALADKVHMGDAWVAATARAHDIPLLAGDQIYQGVDGLRLMKDADD